jgi:hypothetical protein
VGAYVCVDVSICFFSKKRQVSRCVAVSRIGRFVWSVVRFAQRNVMHAAGAEDGGVWTAR